MDVDDMLKRYFGVVNLGFVALAAYFHASALTQMIGAALAPPATWFYGASETRPPSKSAVVPDDHATVARAILDRNPFDSVTPRPLDAPVAPPDGSSSALTACQGIRAIVAVASWEPAWSVAVLAGPDGGTKLVRTGDAFAGKTVELVEWNRVVLKSGPAVCEMVMFRSDKPRDEAAKPPARATETSGVPPGGVPLGIVSKIRRLGPTEFDVDRQAIAEIIERQADLMRNFRIVPFQQDGKVLGLRLFGIRPDNILGMLGLEEGDRLQTINGFELSNPENAMQAFARLRTADHLVVQVNRRGQDTNLDFNVK
jgi:general secretion pathway protein C